MSDTEALPRPRQVTVAGGLALLAAVLMVVSTFDAMAQVRSVQTRSDIADFLGRPPGNGMGVGVDEIVRLLRVVILADAALAAAAVVLAVFVLQRHRGARIALTGVAAVLVVTSPMSGVVLPVALAIAVTMLWSLPARDWFAGRKPRPVPAPAERRSDEPAARPWAPPTTDSRLADEAAPQPGPSPYPFGSAPGPQGTPNAPYPKQSPPQQSYPQQSYPPQDYPAPYPPQGHPVQGGYPGYPAWGPPGERRPATVVAAAWITWVLGGITVAGYVMVLAMMVAARGTFLQALRNDPQVSRLNLSTQDIMAALWVLGVILILWSLSAMVLAFLAYRRVAWARVTLTVSAGLAGVVALAAFPLGLVYTFAAWGTIALLFTGGANAWYVGRGPGGPSYGQGVWPPPQPLQQPSPYGQQPPASPEGQPGEQPKPPKNVW